MTRTAKENVKIVLCCFIVMLALPAAYRLWLFYHPQPEEPRQTLSQFLEKAAEENAIRLLKTPVSKWLDGERKAEPKIAAWLTAHEKTVLPWEWTEEARGKDADGYRKLWVGLFKEQETDLASRLKAVQKKLKTLEREVWIAETIHSHRTNQLARVQSFVATNAYPVTVQVERLAKGRLWGWNKTTERVQLKQQSDFIGADAAWVEVESRAAKMEERENAERMVSLRRVQDDRALYADKLACIGKMLGRLEESARLDPLQCQKVLCDLLKTE